ncbi:hypothetical protein ACHAPU_001658 [Fusarium lateritium]
MNDAKFSSLLKKTQGELRSVFSGHGKKKSVSESTGKPIALVHLFPQLTLVLLEDESSTLESKPCAKKNETKSTWASLFDTKSGNKLHKRAKSAPTTVHTPHVLEAINEEVEYNEAPIFKFMAQPTDRNNSSAKAVCHKPLPSTDNRMGEEDDDAASFMTTCTVLIQQLALEDVPEEDEEEESLETAAITTITPAPEVATIKVRNSNSSRVATTSSQESPVPDPKITRAVGGRSITSSNGPHIRFECSGALPPKETLINVDGVENEAKASKSNNKTSSSTSGLRSIFTKVLGSGKKPEGTKIAEEGPKTGSSTLRVLRHKAQKSFSLGRFTDFLHYAGTHVRSSHTTNQKNERPSTECNKTNDTCEPLKWDLPPCNNEMGELIRSFSGPLTEFTTSVSNSRIIEEVHVARRPRSESSDIPEHDISVENLPPMPAILPAFLQLYNGDVSVQIDDERVQELRDNHRGQHKTSDETSHYSQDVHLGPFPAGEVIENVFQRHIELVTNTYDFSQHTAVVETYNPSEVQEPEERLVREITDEPEEPLKEAESPVSHAGTQEEAYQNVEQHSEDAHVDAHIDVQDIETITQTEQVLEIVHPIPIRRVTAEFLVETHDQHNAATFAMVPSVEWHAQSVPEGSEGNPPTCSAMKQIEHEDQAEYFKSLQNFRTKTPDRLYGRSGFSGVMPWAKDIAKLASKNEVVYDQDAVLFFQQPASATGSNDSVSDLGATPDADEVRAALRHPQAPFIDNCEPDRVAEHYRELRKSVVTDTISTEANHARISSIISRTEVILNEWDRAARVYQLFEEKREQEGADAAYKRQKIYRYLEKKLVAARGEAKKTSQEAQEAEKCVQRLKQQHDDLVEDIHRFTESFGHRRASNLPDAVDLVRLTEREEKIDYRRLNPIEEAPDAESPESEMAERAGIDYSELVRDDHSEVYSWDDPTAEFF